MNQHYGKIIAGLFFVGGAAIIRSLMRTEINMTFLITGCVILLLALVLLIQALLRI